MASRSDQLHSHQFTLQRVIKALALRDPDVAASPTRRAVGASFASVMMAVLAVAAVGVYGAVRPKRESLVAGVARGHHRERRPVLASSTAAGCSTLFSTWHRLCSSWVRRPAPAATGTAGGPGRVPRGTPLGIPGAPDSLPAAGDLVTGAWSLCSGPPPATRWSPPGARLSQCSRSVATPPWCRSASCGAGRRLLGGLHVLWHGHRYPVQRPGRWSSAALGWSGRTPVRRWPTAVLNAIPAGPALAPVVAPRAQAPSVLAGHQVGDVLVVSSEGGERQYAVVGPDGLADITQVQADLSAGGPRQPAERAVRDDCRRVRGGAAGRSRWCRPATIGRRRGRPSWSRRRPRAGCMCVLSGRVAARLGLAVQVWRSGGQAGDRLGEVRVDRAAGVATVDVVRVAPGRGAVVESIAGGLGVGPACAGLGPGYPLPAGVGRGARHPRVCRRPAAALAERAGGVAARRTGRSTRWPHCARPERSCSDCRGWRRRLSTGRRSGVAALLRARYRQRRQCLAGNPGRTARAHEGEVHSVHDAGRGRGDGSGGGEVRRRAAVIQTTLSSLMREVEAARSGLARVAGGSVVRGGQRGLGRGPTPDAAGARPRRRSAIRTAGTRLHRHRRRGIESDAGRPDLAAAVTGRMRSRCSTTTWS